LDGLVTKVYEFGNKKVREHLGGIYEFLRNKNMDSMRELEASSSQKQAVEAKEKETASESKLSYEARKELNRKIKKAEKSVEDIEGVVMSLEAEIAGMDTQLQDPVKASDSDFIMQYQKKQRELEQRMYEWELLTEQLEELKSEQ
jgi:ATP-binding cassette subfamily F protein 3